MAAETNLIKTADLARVREIDFTLMFSDSVKKLEEALGITRKIPKQAGSILKAYKATGTLQDGTVAEGDVIPLSKYEVEAVNTTEITLRKWRKATSAEAIIERGYDQAVSMTTARMLKDVQKTIRSDFFTFLATGTGTATGVGLQAALAQTWGQLQKLFEDDEVEAVYFLNPLDVADYLATAQISMQSAFGMSYVEDFLGLGTVFFNSSVPKGTIYATAKDNIVLYYVPVTGNEFGDTFQMTADETGYIGIHEYVDYTRMTAEDTVVNGMALFAERLDGIVKGTITAGGVSARLSGLTIGALTLDPTFDGDVTEYAATTTNATNTITATAEDDDAEITILNGETPVTNGSAATWAEGANTVKVTLTNGAAQKVYTVTVTKNSA